MSHLLSYPGHDLILKDIVRAENCHLYDSQGNKYVDLESGVWCTSVGHGNPRVLRAIADKSAQIAHTGFNYSNRIVEDTAGEILSLLGLEGGKCVFLCSGSESVEYGVRVAQSVADRPLLMTMADSYFGAPAQTVRIPTSVTNAASTGRQSPTIKSEDSFLSPAVLRVWSGFHQRN